MEFTYSAKGIVLGECWGGGAGYYPTITLVASTIEELENKINDALREGSLDDGFGFQYLIAANMRIKTQSTIEVDGLSFENERFHGKLFVNNQIVEVHRKFIEPHAFPSMD